MQHAKQTDVVSDPAAEQVVKEPDPTKDGFVQPTRQKRFDS